MAQKQKFPETKNVCVDKSKIHRYGIFAKQPFKKGEVVHVIKGEIRKWNVKDEKTALYGPNWIGIGKATWIDPTGISQYLNHSSNPNCGIKGRVTICALKKIKLGEEITIDYSIIEAEPLWWMRDNTNGRELVRSIQFLPLKKFKKYLPYIPHYFQKVYQRYHKTFAKK